MFSVLNGTRQGSVISTTLFNIFINTFIIRLRSLGIGCVVQSMSIGCLLYADDMILLCPGVKGLQSMLDSCVGVANDLSLTFNSLKSAYLAMQGDKSLSSNYRTVCLTSKFLKY